MLDVNEQIRLFQEFLEMHYLAELFERVRKGEEFLQIDFGLLAKFSPELADLVLEQPEETLKAGEISLTNFDLPKEVKKFHLRLTSVAEKEKILIRNVRSKHLGKLLVIEGVVRQKSDVRPQVTSAKFECPSCGNVISVLQVDTKFKEPSRCGCGRKGKFRLLSKELIDAQGIVLEESSKDLEGGEQPKRVNILLKNDLVSPLSEKKTNPGTSIRVIGILKEVPIIFKSGGQSTKFDLMIEANNVEALEEDYTSIEINEEEIKEILELAKDPKIFQKLSQSLAPGIYGHDKVKEALILQFMGGVRKKRDDGVMTRGDIHMLLIGDPGCIAGDSRVALHHKGMHRIQTLGKTHLQPLREAVTIPRKHPRDLPYDFTKNFQIYKHQPTLKMITETGKELIGTYNQPLLTTKGWERMDALSSGDEIRVMPKLPNVIKSYKNTLFTSLKRSSGKRKEIILPKKTTPELAALYGYILGDGSIHKRGYAITCYVNEQEKDLVELLQQLLVNLFGVIASVYRKEKKEEKRILDKRGVLRSFTSQMPIYRLEVNSREINVNLAFLSQKCVPQVIFESPLDVMSAFLRWLFEADGCCFGKGRGRTSVQLKSAHPQLLKDVQLLLLYFGIQARIMGDNLCIRRSIDIQLFAKKIGFVSQKKKVKLKAVVQHVKGKSNQQKRKVVQRYERIASIMPHGNIDVYDFEVPRSKQFIANGIVCHNSGKSQMLKRAAVVAPKARYVSGKGSSGAGLTASVVRDEFLSGWSLEAGALVLANRGILMIDELDKMNPEDRSAMHEGLEQQSFHYDTLLQCSDGSEIKIGEYVERLMQQSPHKLLRGKDCYVLKLDAFDKKLLTTDGDMIYETSIDRISKHKAPETFVEITLWNGRRILVTPEHPVFCINHSRIITKEAKDVTIKDWIPVPLHLPIAGEEQFFSLSHAEVYNERALQHIKVPVHNDIHFFKIMGYLLAEGSHEINRCKTIGINFTNNNKMLIDDFQRCMKMFFNLEAYIQQTKKPGESWYCARYVSTELVTFIQGIVPEILELAPKKCIPGVCMKGTMEHIAAMLSCMFEGDGHAAKKVRTIRVGYATTSRRMAEQVQDLLLRFKIRTNLTEHRGCYKIGITGYENLLRFYQSIRFVSREKNAIVEDYLLKSTAKVIRTVKDVIPCCGEELVALLKKYNVSTVGKNILATMKHDYITKKKNISRRHLQRAVLLLEQKQIRSEDWECLRMLRNFAFGELGFERVRDVKVIPNTDQEWTYDLTIEPTHSFISQNMMLHNTISISKANIQATLRCETTVLAAANPKFGRFDPYETIAKQIDLPPALINRFDLIFTIKDIPDAEKDEQIAHFILTLHKKQGTQTPPIETQLLRKYLIYGRQKINPTLTQDAFEELKSYYVKMRTSGMTEEKVVKAIPLSARQLEALVRLSEAAAKARLSETVERKDAKRAISLLQYCLEQVGLDPETGKIDIDRISTGISTSERTKMIGVRELIHELEEKLGKIIPLEEVVKAAQEKGISEEKVVETIEKLKRSGDLFEPKRGHISRI